MRVGDIIKIFKCASMPEVVGESAQIVDLHLPEFEKYRTYPLWLKMLSGQRKGKVYGFQYDEVGLPPDQDTGLPELPRPGIPKRLWVGRPAPPLAGGTR
ncbi:hypothetical protein ES708_04471 [subsurface metagenome]